MATTATARPQRDPARRAAILRAAASVFADSGYAATSMEDVAAASGVTKLIVYRHFESKEALYRSVLERVFDRQVELFVENVAAGLQAGGTTRALLLVGRESPDGFRLLWRHAAREPQFAEYVHNFRDAAVDAARAVVEPYLAAALRRVGRADPLRPPRRRGPQLARPRRTRPRTSRSSRSKPRRCAPLSPPGRRRSHVGRERGTRQFPKAGVVVRRRGARVARDSTSASCSAVSTARSDAIATSSCSRSGSRVVSLCSHRPGFINTRTHPRCMFFAASRITS